MIMKLNKNNARDIAQKRSLEVDYQIAVVEVEDWATESISYGVVNYENYRGSDDAVVAVYQQGYCCQ